MRARHVRHTQQDLARARLGRRPKMSTRTSEGKQMPLPLLSPLPSPVFIVM
jgi:hypothetical protein